MSPLPRKEQSMDFELDIEVVRAQFRAERRRSEALAAGNALLLQSADDAKLTVADRAVEAAALASSVAQRVALLAKARSRAAGLRASSEGFNELRAAPADDAPPTLAAPANDEPPSTAAAPPTHTGPQTNRTPRQKKRPAKFDDAAPAEKRPRKVSNASASESPRRRLTPGAVMGRLKGHLSNEIYTKEEIKELRGGRVFLARLSVRVPTARDRRRYPGGSGSHMPAVYMQGSTIYALTFSEDTNPGLPNSLDISAGDGARKKQVNGFQKLQAAGAAVPLFVCLKGASGALETFRGGGKKAFRFYGFVAVERVDVHETHVLVLGEARQATVFLKDEDACRPCPLSVDGELRPIDVATPVTPLVAPAPPPALSQPPAAPAPPPAASPPSAAPAPPPVAPSPPTAPFPPLRPNFALPETPPAAERIEFPDEQPAPGETSTLHAWLIARGILGADLEAVLSKADTVEEILENDEADLAQALGARLAWRLVSVRGQFSLAES